MIVGGQTYYNLTTDGGNSTFEIPITAMDTGMSVIADTTAMGEPVEIQYTLTFYLDSVGGKGNIPQEAAQKDSAHCREYHRGNGEALNYILKKKRK